MDVELVLKLIGAVLTFAFGIWIGLGMPGLHRRSTTQPSSWRAADRLGRTWINRLFFRMDSPPRRFDTGRLVVPKGGGSPGSDEAPKNEKREGREMVRLRRPGGR